MSLPDGFARRPFAHRGLHGAAGPENSLGAIAAAADAGWGIEIDLQRSADGMAMVFHDDHLKRLTGVSGATSARTAQELGALSLADGSPIPTFAAVLALVAGRVPLLVEIKDQDGAMGPGVGPLEEAAARDLHRYDGPVALMSFNPHAADAVRALAPSRPVGLTTCDWRPEDWPHVPEPRRAELRRLPAEADVPFVSHDRRDLASPAIAAAKERGPVYCWTVRSPEQEAEARIHADQITFEGYLPA